MRNVQLPQDLISKLGCKQIIDVTDNLPVNPNYTWAQLAGVRDINDLTTIGLHHDDYPKKNRVNSDDMNFMTDIALDHIKLTKNEKKGDAGFPYHFWIRNGQAYQTNDVLDRTYGIGSNNGYIVHVCVSGDYTQDTLTTEDRNALLGVMYTLAVSLPAYKEVKAHSELNKTECPVYDYNSIRVDLQSLQMKMKQQDTWAAKMKNVADIINQINYLTDRMKLGEKDGDAIWAANAFSDVADMMRSKHLL